jgi:hypothetical protein
MLPSSLCLLSCLWFLSSTVGPVSTDGAVPTATSGTVVKLATPAAVPSSSREDRFRAQLDAGNAYFSDRNFKEAEAAYLRALQSEDPEVRKAALKALGRSLQERHSYWSWLRGTMDELSEKVLRALPVMISVGLGLVMIWLISGIVGRFRGRRQCVVEALDATSGSCAPTFRLALFQAMDERRRLLESLTGTLGPKTVALAIEDSTKETLLSQALALKSAEAGKLAAALLARLNRPRFRLRVGWRREEEKPLMLVVLEVEGKIVRVWAERLKADELFKPRCRLLREIMAYMGANQ